MPRREKIKTPCIKQYENPDKCLVIHYGHGLCRYHYLQWYIKKNAERRADNQRKFKATEHGRVWFRDYVRKYRKRRFFHTRAKYMNQRNGSTLTPKELASLWHKQRGICALSGERLNAHNSEVDHIVPLQKGGSSEVSNLRWLHRIANKAKFTYSDEEFIRFCKKVVDHTAKRGAANSS